MNSSTLSLPDREDMDPDRQGNDRCPDTVQAGDAPFSCAEGAARGIAEFQEIVLSHYLQCGREMPWRNTTDPYRILVSEIMLQQTQVERVMKKFPEFIRTFPDFASLASAPLADILAAWQGMGYNRRAIALQRCAVSVIQDFGGFLPDDPGILETLPGIGRATAGSIAAFAFNRPVIFIETNIRRVFIHFFFPHDAVVSDREILALVDQTLYREDPRRWYWALMDLGAALKKTVSNPNRRSDRYTRQSSFSGSDREIRGNIIKMLVEEGSMTHDEIRSGLEGDTERVKKILRTLESEGFLQCEGKRYRLTDH